MIYGIKNLFLDRTRNRGGWLQQDWQGKSYRNRNVPQDSGGGQRRRPDGIIGPRHQEGGRETRHVRRQARHGEAV